MKLRKIMASVLILGILLGSSQTAFANTAKTIEKISNSGYSGEVISQSANGRDTRAKWGEGVISWVNLPGFKPKAKSTTNVYSGTAYKLTAKLRYVCNGATGDTGVRTAENKSTVSTDYLYSSKEAVVFYSNNEIQAKANGVWERYVVSKEFK